jgi:LemA protein
MGTGTIILIAVAAIAFFYFISTQRELVKLDELCSNAMGQIAVQLKSRWDAVLALAQMLKSYNSHESETLINVINARRQVTVTTAQQANEQQSEFSNVLGRLMAVSEAYPDLKADSLYKETMDAIKDYEEKVRMSRMVYNDSATKMNQMVRQLPSSIVASILHFQVREYFKEDEHGDQYPNIGDVLNSK